MLVMPERSIAPGQSPFVGRRVRGLVRRTLLRGQTVFEDGRVVAPPRGRLLRPARRP
jgi:hypothetical protein